MAAEFRVIDQPGRGYHFIVITTNGRVIATSEHYKTRRAGLDSSAGPHRPPSWRTPPARTSGWSPVREGLPGRAGECSLCCMPVFPPSTEPVEMVLEDLAGGWTAPLELIPFTTDKAEAEVWYSDYAPFGIEGLVVKGRATPYRPGRRDWLKCTIHTSSEMIVGAVLGPLERPDSLVLGRYIYDGEFGHGVVQH